eukprot:TRINITY_DN417_c0_g3_i2.p1 TRINITY_DN417_c0_g3~~TRINITY_DN417_c0_g3_i2.p1  ORF type:complete len:187 (-),score=24.51 TRINITY_DN417_c0_g3_i2:50-610(-)
MAVRLTTTLGDIEITLHPRDTPRTCRNFLELCKHGYYDGVLFHQVVKDTLIKTGDPYGNGTGGESIYGPTFDDEITKKLSHDRMGVVSMANDGHNTNGSMFIITLDAMEHLDGHHTIFGFVPETSWDTLKEFNTVKLKKEKPVKPLKIFSAIVVKDPWDGQDLPEGCSIPEKPLVLQGKNKNCALQ